jgi:nitroimidazol reductase NimA-like FMN-containing flavoprotein (pyridoxamine 5'-phosphate oxidase superfamily)
MKPRDLSQDECTSLLSTVRYGRLALSKDDQPYIVPMSYVYYEGKIYLHSLGKGKKVEFATKNPRVCFQIDVLEKERWSSVVVSGISRLSESMEAKQKMFDAFTKKGQGGHAGKKFSREGLEKMPMTIWEIETLEMTGREGVW